MSVDKRAYLDEVMNLQFYGVVAKDLITRKDLDIYCKYIFMYIVAEGNNWKSSRNNLAKNIGIHKDTVTKYVVKLTEKNILSVKKGAGSSWHFRVNPPSAWAADAPAEWPTPQAGPNLGWPTPSAAGGLPDQQQVAYTTGHILQELKELQVIDQTPKKVAFDLEAIYQIYPRKKGKAGGMKKLTKLVKTEADYKKFMAVVQAYADECIAKGTQQEYIQHFSTFMNSGWQDYEETAAKPKAAPLLFK